MVTKNLDAVILNIPVFAFPNFSVIATYFQQVPCLAIAPENGKLPGLGGLQAAVNMMRQVGLKEEGGRPARRRPGLRRRRPAGRLGFVALRLRRGPALRAVLVPTVEGREVSRFPGLTETGGAEVPVGANLGRNSP